MLPAGVILVVGAGKDGPGCARWQVTLSPFAPRRPQGPESGSKDLPIRLEIRLFVEDVIALALTRT